MKTTFFSAALGAILLSAGAAGARPLPDLTIVDTKTLGAPAPILPQLVVWNKGLGEAPATTVKITCRRLAGHNSCPADFPLEDVVPALRAGGIYIFCPREWYRIQWAPGVYELVAIVDPTKSIRESNERNNTGRAIKVVPKIEPGA